MSESIPDRRKQATAAIRELAWQMGGNPLGEDHPHVSAIAAWCNILDEELAPAAHQETPEPTCRCGHVLESHLNAAAMQHCRECACRAFEEAAPARAAEWQPIATAPTEGPVLVTNGVLRWIAHYPLIAGERGATYWAPISPLPPGALTGDSNSKR